MTVSRLTLLRTRKVRRRSMIGSVTVYDEEQYEAVRTSVLPTRPYLIIWCDFRK